MAEENNRSGQLADLVDEGPARVKSIDRRMLVKMGILAGALVAINWRQFTFLWDDWQMPNWSHGYLIPLFSLFLVYSRFGEIMSVRRRVCWWGLPIVVLAAGFHVAGYGCAIPDQARRRRPHLRARGYRRAYSQGIFLSCGFD